MSSQKMPSHELAAKFAELWVNVANRSYVADQLGELNGLQGAAVAARMVLLLYNSHHDGHNVPMDLATFTGHLEYEVCGELL